MNVPTISASCSNPQPSSALADPTMREYPVPGGSMNTTSAISSGHSGLSITWYGAAPVIVASDGTTMRRGPIAPICSHIEADPGPPLNANTTGLCSGGPASLPT